MYSPSTSATIKVHNVHLNLFSGKRATGVEYVHDGRLKRVFSDKEVILSAGALGSPHILMLSGVGHQKHLEELGVSLLTTRYL